MRRASTKKKGRGRIIKSTRSEVGRRAFLLKRPTMSFPSELRVEVLGDEIIIILPATSYGVTYSKPGNSPNLVAKNCVPKFDAGAPMNSCGIPRKGVAGRERKGAGARLDRLTRDYVLFWHKADQLRRRADVG